MAGSLIVDTGYRPRQLQDVLHRNVKRFNVIVCHRRFGKTHFSLNEMVDRALTNELKNPQYAYIAPTYGQAKRVAWDLLKDYLKTIPGVVFNESDLRAEIPRPHKGDKIKFLLLGAENPGSIRGIHLDGAILDEYAEMDPSVWSQVIRPALTDRLGWAIFIGTPKGQNHFYDIFQAAKAEESLGNAQWFTAVYKASETGIIPLSELEQAQRLMADNEYAQEFECSFSAALVGAYYGKEMEKADEEGRITDVPYDPALPTYTFWDLGVDDSTAIWIGQPVGRREMHWIDYIENSGTGLDWYVKELSDRGYAYEKHYLPHDAAARELGTGKTREEMLRTKGLGARTEIVPRQKIEDGIEASRNLIKRSWFDLEKTKRGVDALKNYERKWDSKNKIYQKTPLHNWASHGSDAFRTGAMGMDERAPREEEKKKYPRQAESDYNPI